MKRPRSSQLLRLSLFVAIVFVREPWAGELPGITEVDGRKIPSLLRRPTASLRVFAFRGEEVVPIPFQVDERDFRNRFAIDQGPSQVRDESPGVFDANDVVVFMNRDLGARGARERLPEARSWLELRVGSEANPLGYAYLGTFDGSPPSEAAADYCRYDAPADRIYAERYTVGFGAPLPTYLGFVRHLGDSGENVLAAVRAHGEARILGGLITLRRTEKDLRSTLQGYRQGEVRTIRHGKYWIELPLGFKARARVDLLFYRDLVEARASAKITIPPRLIPADGDLTAHFDFLDFAASRVLVPGEPLPVDGRTREADQRLAERPARWAALLLPDGRTLLLATRLGGALQKLKQVLYFVNDAESTDRGPTAQPGFGFRLSRMNRLDTGVHELVVAAMILDAAEPGRIVDAANLLLEPPEVVITPLSER